MTITISRAFDNWDQAQGAVRALDAAGVPQGDVSLVANSHVDDRYARAVNTDTARDEGGATGTGLGTGAVLGGGAGLLAGLGMIAIPGIGPVVAAGWLAATAAGAAAGATTGGIVGALVDAGEDKDAAHVYAETVRRGGTVVTVRTADANREKVERALDRYQPVDYRNRATEYREGGWKEFDAAAKPYTPSASDIERIRRKWPDAAE